MKRQLIPFIVFCVAFFNVNAQMHNPVTWEYSVKAIGNNTIEIKFNANIDEGWHLYGLNIPENGPYPTSVNFNDSTGLKFVGEVTTSKKPKVKFDETFEMDLELFNGIVTFMQQLKMDAPKTIEGYVEYMVCDDKTCLPPTEFNFTIAEDEIAGHLADSKTKVEKSVVTNVENKDDVKPTKVKTNIQQSGLSEKLGITIETKADEADVEIEVEKSADRLITPKEENATSKGLGALFFIALAAGFGALLTPCVYPMIPLTVSFFMKEGQARSKTIFNGVVFGISIIFIYTLVGFISGVFKIDLVRLVSSHWIPNAIFFAIFILLAISFFGAFEIVLPSSIANKIDRQADKGGILGPFFMALATVIVSFSCTGPIVGVVLGSALKGDIITPVVGMLGFSTSFALPFALLAIFPGVLGNLPKSGGWLNSVKVFFAFILLAFSLVFLGNLGLSFIGRDFILAITIIIFALLGLYLLGKISFAHDSPVQKVSIFRLVLAIFSFAIAVFLLPGMWGKSLGAIEPFLPAAKVGTQIMMTATDNNPSSTKVSPQKLCHESPKYSDKLHLPHGLRGYFDYNEALACAKDRNKPLFIDFVGHTCKNCKKMYADVWSDNRVLKLLSEEYVVVALYTDDRTKLPENDWYTSEFDGKTKKTLGKKNLALQVDKFGSNALPLYAIVNGNGDVVTEQSNYTYDLDVEKFIAYLEEGLRDF